MLSWLVRERYMVIGFVINDILRVVCGGLNVRMHIVKHLFKYVDKLMSEHTQLLFIRVVGIATGVVSENMTDILQ